ncbi:hypothetical protein BC826DRAFT_1190668 [Russula brevipes]|nr:hypothetical protein BC826DRAFT_1190668 [Russula brevipes]
MSHDTVVLLDALRGLDSSSTASLLFRLECGDSASLSFLPSPSISLFFPTTEPIWLLNITQSESSSSQAVSQPQSSSPKHPSKRSLFARSSPKPWSKSREVKSTPPPDTKSASPSPSSQPDNPPNAPAPGAPVAPTPSFSPSSSYPATSILTASTQQGPPVTGPHPPADQASSAHGFMGLSSLRPWSNVGKNRKPRKEAHSGNDMWPSARPSGEVTRRASVERLVQATTVRSAAPPTFASGSESCPKPLGPKFVGFAPQVFRVRACDHLSSPSDDSRFPRANGGEHCAASATQTAASAALPTQRERRRAPRCQRNANGGEHRAASAKRTAANTAQPEQRERRRTPRSQSNANGGEHRAASATRTAASTALPVQRKRQRAPRCQRNANGGERHAASATRAAGTVAPALSHSRPPTDAPVAVLQVNDTGPNADRKAPLPTRATIPGRDEVLVPTFGGDRTVTQHHALCARCCMVQTVSIKTLSSAVQYVLHRLPLASQRALDGAHRMHHRTQQAFFHMQNELEGILITDYIPLAAPRLGIPTLPSTTSSLLNWNSLY